MQPMQIVLNGSTRECPAHITLATLLDEAGFAQRRVAVEVNRQIVSRSQHTSHILNEGDRVEIVHAIGGG
jgi:sulfur carrier protein